MATRSFRIFATREDLSAIFSDFQKELKVHYFACGRMNELRETYDITNIPLFAINKNGNHVNNHWLICRENVMPLKRKNNMIAENAYLYKKRYRFCTISIDSPEMYDLKVE